METIAENINKLYSGNRKQILKHYLSIDQSNLQPIRNKFNCTKRAINRLRKYEKLSGEYLSGLELCYFLDNELSEIVNNEKNW